MATDPLQGDHDASEPLRSRLAIADALVTFAQERHVTQLVLGQSVRGRFDILIHGSVINHILRNVKNVDLLLMADRANER